MGLGHEVAKRIGRVLRPVRSTPKKLAASKLGTADNAVLAVTSSAFHVGYDLPRAATADGEGVPPPLTWRGVPHGARSMVVICEDPDAPLPEPFVHWIVYGIPAQDGTLDAALLGSASGVREGKNSLGRSGYTGAAPPAGHGTHHYHFQVFALDTELSLEPGAGRTALLEAMRGHVVAWGDLVGTYGRRR